MIYLFFSLVGFAWLDLPETPPPPEIPRRDLRGVLLTISAGTSMFGHTVATDNWKTKTKYLLGFFSKTWKCSLIRFLLQNSTKMHRWWKKIWQNAQSVTYVVLQKISQCTYISTFSKLESICCWIMPLLVNSLYISNEVSYFFWQKLRFGLAWHFSLY